MNATARVYADFQNLDDFNRLKLTCAGTLEDLRRQGIELREGLALSFYTDDADDAAQPDELRAEGVVHYNEAEHCWVAAVDWNAVRHASNDADGETMRKAPHNVGDTLKYVGRTRYRNGEVLLSEGMIGTVVENRERSPHPKGVLYEPRSVVEFPNGTRIFVKPGDRRVVRA